MANDINVLLVSSKFPPEYSGSGHRAFWLYQRLTRKYPDIKLQVICGSETDNENCLYEYEGVTVYRVACKPYERLSHDSGLMGRFKRTFQNSANFSAEREETLKALRGLERRPDIIHVFGENYVTATVLAYARSRRVPVILELCNEMDSPKQYIPFPDKLWTSNKLPRDLLMVCISERLQRVCQANGLGDKTWCRPNPVDETRFKPPTPEEKKATRAAMTKFNPDAPLIVYIAKFIPRKNHIFLVDVLANLPKEYNLLIGGPLTESGPYGGRNRQVFEGMVARIESYRFNDRVQIHAGFIENIEDYYRVADVYMFPTKEEGLGTPMLESLACGAPVVANRIPGITDTWIRDGENGFIRDLDPEAFAEAVEMARAFPEEQRTRASRDILNIAGTGVIDQTYYDHIRNMSAR